MTMSVEVGLSYETRSGTVVTIVKQEDRIACHIPIFVGDNTRKYFSDGVASTLGVSCDTIENLDRWISNNSLVKEHAKETTMTDNSNTADFFVTNESQDADRKLSIKTRTRYRDKKGNVVDIDQCQMIDVKVNGTHLVLYRGHVGEEGIGYYTERGHSVSGYNHYGVMNFEDLVSEIGPS